MLSKEHNTDKLSLEKIINDHYEILDAFYFIGFFENIMNNYFENDANLVAQKCFMHACSLRNLNITPLFRSKKMKIRNIINAIDVLSMFSLLRSQYETFLTFSYIFVYSDKKEEKHIKYLLWKIAGLSSRQSSVNQNRISDTDKEKLEDEKKSISKYIDEIKGNDFFLNKDENDKKKILDMIKNKIWRISLIETPHKLSWNQIAVSINMNAPISKLIYKYLSWYAHSEFSAIIQFRDMYKKDYDTRSIRLCLDTSTKIMCCLIYDYCKLFPYAKNNYDKLTTNTQEYITFFNNVYRNQRIS